jgi:hypothetical protein
VAEAEPFSWDGQLVEDKGVLSDCFDVVIRNIIGHQVVEDQAKPALQEEEDCGVEAARLLVHLGRIMIDGIYS